MSHPEFYEGVCPEPEGSSFDPDAHLFEVEALIVVKPQPRTKPVILKPQT